MHQNKLPLEPRQSLNVMHLSNSFDSFSCVLYYPPKFSFRFDENKNKEKRKEKVKETFFLYNKKIVFLKLSNSANTLNADIL